MKDDLSLQAALKCIKSSIELIAAGKNEQAIRDSFTSYLRSIFPDSPSWVERHIKSSETAVTISRGQKMSVGFVDNLVDLTVIEYESNLASSTKFNEGFNQLGDYCASLINSGHKPDLILGIVSDTVQWFAYTVKVKPGSPKSGLTRENLDLFLVERLNLSTSDLHAARQLIAFLTKYLGRLGARPLNANFLADDLGFASEFCISHLTTLERLVEKAFKEKPEYADLIASLWCKFVSYFRDRGSAELFDIKAYADELYLLTLGKLICANVIEARGLLSDDRDLETILNGHYFVSKGLTNLVEYDYFGWLNEPPYIESQLTAARAIQHDLLAYDFSQTPADDLFGNIMAQFAERSKRLLLGQELTPAWLAGRTVEKAINMLADGDLPHFVDMCCGSGAMIVETVKRTKEKIEKSKSAISTSERLQLLTQAVTGFDIDPLAVILSKINWVVVARDWLEPFGTNIVAIPVYHADSLFAITPLTDGVQDETKEDFQLLKVAEYTIKLPKFLLDPKYQAFFDGILERAYTIVTASASTKLVLSDNLIDETIQSLAQTHASELASNQKQAAANFMRDFIERVDSLNRDGRNGIWAFILRNSYRPGLVAGQFNGLVSNPPWLALSKVANNPYQSLLKKKAEAFGITPPGSSHLHIELSTIFLLHSIDLYLRKGAVIGCIAPETILNGHHHNPFRLAKYKATAGIDFALESIWRVEKGTFKNNAIVLFGRKAKSAIDEPDPIAGARVAETHTLPLEFKRQKQGMRTAWSDQSSANSSVEGGFFEPANFRQGADIMPRTLFLFDVKPVGDSNAPSNWQIKSIDPTTSRIAFAVKDAKKKEDFRITPCVVPDDMLFDVLTSKLLTPFQLASPLKALLPLRRENGWCFLTSVEVAAKGGSVQNVFREICSAIGKNADVSDIAALVNVRNKLTQQYIESDRYLVLTGAGGGNVCCSFISTNSLNPAKTIVDQTLYWAEVETEDEAYYLAGLFNSAAINDIIREFQPQGAFGERHVHKLPFGVTPPFDSTQAAHQEVVKRTRELQHEYAIFIAKAGREMIDPNFGTLAQRRRMLQDKIKRLASYAEYESACRDLYGI